MNRMIAVLAVLAGAALATGAQAERLTHAQIVAKAWEIANERSGYYDEVGGHVRGPIAQGTVDQLIREMEAENGASGPVAAQVQPRRKKH